MLKILSSFPGIIVKSYLYLENLEVISIVYFLNQLEVSAYKI